MMLLIRRNSLVDSIVHDDDKLFFRPLNPLGSRFEIQLTITWIKTHLEEDQQVSLPKHEVYDDYL